MPEYVQRSVKSMGIQESHFGDLRNVASGKLKMKFCTVMFYGDETIGWAAYYLNYPFARTSLRLIPWASFWVKHCYRGNGYGKMLIRKMHKLVIIKQVRPPSLYGGWLRRFWKTL